MSSEQAPDETDESDGISFGDVEQTQPNVELRPDQNKHYAVAPVFRPGSDDLPIYVDVDALLDMERHALDDTSVELGGVMLGGQYLDDNGQPFVLISDSLRAEHYESTKGSFKFTHETWSKITLQREEFPDELQMVGWYHTHPDWGVFLSGMDMFICNNFFNKPLDVALVIDPCRNDRGMFMWVDSAAGRVRRTDGFYLIGSRFREQELATIATHLQDESAMVDPRYPSPAPQVIQTGDSMPPWMLAAVLGVLLVQMSLVALLAWKILTPVETNREAELAVVEERLEEIVAQQQRQDDREAQLRVLDQVVSQFGQGGRPDPVSLLARKDAELLKSQQDEKLATAAASMAVEKHEQAVEQSAVLQERLLDLEEKLAALETERNELQEFKKSIESADEEDGDGESDQDSQTLWFWGAVSAVGFFLAAAIGAMFIGRRPPPEETPDQAPQFTDSDGPGPGPGLGESDPPAEPLEPPPPR